jgi:hypothetical protein
LDGAPFFRAEPTDKIRAFEQTSAALKRVADTLHDAQIEREIVDGVERRGERLSGLHEMTQISARIAAADGAIAIRVGWVFIFGILFVLDVEAAFTGEK